MSQTNRKVFRSPEAQEDLLDIWDYGANEWSPEQADQHLRDIDNMCDRFRDDPKLGHKRDDLIPGLRSMYVRPHLVFYRISADAVTIVRVLHERFDAAMRFRR